MYYIEHKFVTFDVKPFLIFQNSTKPITLFKIKICEFLYY